MTTAIKTAATSQQQVRDPTRELDKAERRDELLDSELDTVTGGSFDLGSIVGGLPRQWCLWSAEPKCRCALAQILIVKRRAPCAPYGPHAVSCRLAVPCAWGQSGAYGASEFPVTLGTAARRWCYVVGRF